MGVGSIILEPCISLGNNQITNFYFAQIVYVISTAKPPPPPEGVIDVVNL